VVTEDARAYVRRHHRKFDLIYSLSSNSFAALASGAFAMAENYLFTTEAFRDYWRALSDDGFLSMEHQFYMPRLVSQALDALRAEGVAQPTAHLAVYDLPKMRRKLLLVSKRPLTDEIRNLAYGELAPEKFEHIHLLFPAPEGLEDNLINRIVGEGWHVAAEEAPVDLSPATDDRPFVAQLGLWKNFDRNKLEGVSPVAEVMGFPLAKLLTVTILAVVVGLVIPLNLVPYLLRRDRLRLGPWLYFFCIGMAFMMVEVVLIHKYTGLVGPSVYSLATILLTLLICSGLGSRLSRVVDYRLAFGGIAVFLLLDVFVCSRLIPALGSLGVAPRMLATAGLVAPLGFFMGMPFPKAGLRVGERIAWGLAVNGAGSVFGATAILLVAFAYGFSAALLLALGSYLLAFALFAWKRAW
jgi:hypothetical protein